MAIRKIDLMREILLVNDDGLTAEGLTRLRNELLPFGKITVVAPLDERSGSSHAITISQPLFVSSLSNRRPRVSSYTVKGTPVDCVKLALAELLKKAPDLVISGINLGANVGVDVFYSGTVAAALEAALWDINSFAISVARPLKGYPDFRLAAKLGIKIVRSILASRSYPGVVFNINIPCLPLRRIRGIKYTRQDLSMVRDEFYHGRNPRGGQYYRIKSGSEAKRDKKQNVSWRNQLPQVISDRAALKSGYISITPLKPDLSYYQILAKPPRVSKL